MLKNGMAPRSVLIKGQYNDSNYLPGNFPIIVLSFLSPFCTG